jgi:hypothetical protein
MSAGLMLATCARKKLAGILEQVYRTVTKTQAVDEHGVRSGQSIEKIGVMSRPGSTRATTSGSMRHFGVCVHFAQVCSVCLVCWRQLSSIWFVLTQGKHEFVHDSINSHGWHGCSTSHRRRCEDFKGAV